MGGVGVGRGGIKGEGEGEGWQRLKGRNGMPWCSGEKG